MLFLLIAYLIKKASTKIVEANKEEYLAG